ncbi:MAG: hypothetical protein WCP21_19810 [Armatimonadota bacterium]
MPFVRTTILLGLILMSTFASAGKPTPVQFKSSRPLFFKLAMDPAGATALLFAVDESKGSRTGYDVLYWYTNHDEAFQPREKRHAEVGSGPATFLVPMPHALCPAPVAEGIKQTLSARIMVYSLGGSSPTVMTTLSLRLQREEEVWSYALTATGLTPAQTIAEAPILRAAPLTVTPTVRADRDCGLAARIEAADYSLSCSGPGDAPMIGILITDSSGQTVHQDSVPLARLGFG